MKISAIAPACAAVLLATIVQADAQARRAAAPKKNAASVTITNGRSAPLQEFQLTTTGDTPIVVAKLAKPLAPGKSATISIKGKRGCVFDIRGAYADDATVENDGHDLCKDSKLKLSE